MAGFRPGFGRGGMIHSLRVTMGVGAPGGEKTFMFAALMFLTATARAGGAGAMAGTTAGGDPADEGVDTAGEAMPLDGKMTTLLLDVLRIIERLPSSVKARRQALWPVWTANRGSVMRSQVSTKGEHTRRREGAEGRELEIDQIRLKRRR